MFTIHNERLSPQNNAELPKFIDLLWVNIHSQYWLNIEKYVQALRILENLVNIEKIY